MGSGRWGRGVYAVPCFMIPRFSPIYDDDFEEISRLQSDEISTNEVWKWLINKERHGTKHSALIQFESHPDFYPLDLYLGVQPEFSKEFLKRIMKENDSTYVISKDNFDYVNEALSHGWSEQLAIKVQDVNSLGKVLNIYKSSGAKLWDKDDDSIEVVIRKPVSSKNIKKIIARYQTNKEFKARNRK